MAVNLSPIGNGINFLGNTGLPLVSGQLFTYQAGSSTPLLSYQDNNGLIANSNPIILGTNGRLPSELWFSSGYTYKLVLEDSSNNVIATYDNIYGILGTNSGGSTSVPSGSILIWSGSIGSIPSGYYLCDGTNGTPNLKDKFIVGAGNTYSVAQTGGSTDAIVVTHTHTASVTDPGHFHLESVSQTGGGTIGVSQNTNTGSTAATTQTQNAFTGISVTNASTGSSGTNANLPPYYALAYIMKA
jgi:hypothetical protein